MPLPRKSHEEHNDTYCDLLAPSFRINSPSRVIHKPIKWPLMKLRVKVCVPYVVIFLSQIRSNIWVVYKKVAIGIAI